VADEGWGDSGTDFEQIRLGAAFISAFLREDQEGCEALLQAKRDDITDEMLEVFDGLSALVCALAFKTPGGIPLTADMSTAQFKLAEMFSGWCSELAKES
jgi:hypothetical protein